MWLLRKEGTHRVRVPDEKLSTHRPVDWWIPSLRGEPTLPKQRTRTPIEGQQLRHQVREWLAESVIECCPEQPLINNTVHVAKKNGSIRVCIDCTPVNAVTEDYDWALPRLQD